MIEKLELRRQQFGPRIVRGKWDATNFELIAAKLNEVVEAVNELRGIAMAYQGLDVGRRDIGYRRQLEENILKSFEP